MSAMPEPISLRLPILHPLVLRLALVVLFLPVLAAASPPADSAAPAPPSGTPSVTDTAAPASAPEAAPTQAAPAATQEPGAPATASRPARHASHARKRPSSAAPLAADGTAATVALTTQPGSELETTATRLVSSDLKQSRSAGDPPVMLVGSARLSVTPGPAALFVQVQSADFCGSAGCSTSAYLKHGADWTKVLDSISGPIKVSRRSHHGMYDLLVHGKDRWVWNGTSYADTLPDPAVDLLHSVRK